MLLLALAALPRSRRPAPPWPRAGTTPPTRATAAQAAAPAPPRRSRCCTTTGRRALRDLQGLRCPAVTGRRPHGDPLRPLERGLRQRALAASTSPASASGTAADPGVAGFIVKQARRGPPARLRPTAPSCATAGATRRARSCAPRARSRRACKQPDKRARPRRPRAPGDRAPARRDDVVTYQRDRASTRAPAPPAPFDVVLDAQRRRPAARSASARVAAGASASPSSFAGARAARPGTPSLHVDASTPTAEVGRDQRDEQRRSSVAARPSGG